MSDKKPTLFGWFTTAPNPRHPGTGHDAGQRGWRLHAVVLTEDTKPEELGKYTHFRSLCGTQPSYGWGLDLFIEAECQRCVRLLKLREEDGEVFEDLPARRAKEYQERRQRELDAEYEQEIAEESRGNQS